MSNPVRPHRRQPTRLPCPWNSPGENTGVGCHFFLQCMKVKSESEVAQSCLTLSDPMDCSPPGSSVHGIFQAGVLEWGAIAFSECRASAAEMSGDRPQIPDFDLICNFNFRLIIHLFLPGTLKGTGITCIFFLSVSIHKKKKKALRSAFLVVVFYSPRKQQKNRITYGIFQGLFTPSQENILFLRAQRIQTLIKISKLLLKISFWIYQHSSLPYK